MNQPISHTLRNLAEGQSLDEATLVAGVINLYLRNLKRIHGVSNLMGQDVLNIGQIVEIMMAPRPTDYRPKGKTEVNLEQEISGLVRRDQ